ncbi:MULTISPECIES: hypothetical protein [unclassified Spirillospora]|uniref:hypothetical protein n=1 Tax=unclassified Spirillospora TaxID=2642701 RepID=UPI00370FA09A
MTDEQDTGEWRSEELRPEQLRPEQLRPEPRRPERGFHLPWLALIGVAATIVAATTLVIGIGDSLGDDRPAGRLLPLQAASPPPSSAPPSASPSASPSPADPDPEDSPAQTREPGSRIHEALLRLRFSVDEAVEEGDVRDDVGIDLANVIERILDRPWSPPERRRADVAYLHHKIDTRTREGGISGHRADEFHLILDHATN